MKLYGRIAKKIMAIADLEWEETEEQKCREGLTVLFAMITNLLILLLIGIITGTWKLLLALVALLIGMKWFIKTLKSVGRDMSYHDENK